MRYDTALVFVISIALFAAGTFASPHGDDARALLARRLAAEPGLLAPPAVTDAVPWPATTRAIHGGDLSIDVPDQWILFESLVPKAAPNKDNPLIRQELIRPEPSSTLDIRLCSADMFSISNPLVAEKLRQIARRGVTEDRIAQLLKMDDLESQKHLTALFLAAHDIEALSDTTVAEIISLAQSTSSFVPIRHWIATPSQLTASVRVSSEQRVFRSHERRQTGMIVLYDRAGNDIGTIILSYQFDPMATTRRLEEIAIAIASSARLVEPSTREFSHDNKDAKQR